MRFPGPPGGLWGSSVAGSAVVSYSAAGAVCYRPVLWHLPRQAGRAYKTAITELAKRASLAT